ncbi:hypothetical protein Lupro_03065 [Lutibacter profundi]|uniref:Uncharacterized protein n=1 Tax=Lutibacter profundi TaxID=1622118 RepID=A0A0X8G592_9FLAO|nr:hypothetical protein [Lutibacter profundi]AMC10296.1 hypothetical protein Lupro_03065 [Lutibacter profundi]
MKNIFILLTVIILFNSCKKTNGKININGKWNTLSNGFGYMEFDIDSDKIGIFSHLDGDLGLIEYKLLNDSLFIGSNTSFKIEKISDSLIILKNISQNDTLRKMNKTIMTYHEIDSKNDSLLDIFYEKFEKRIYKKWIKSGYVTEDELKNSFLDSIELKFIDSIEKSAF